MIGSVYVTQSATRGVKVGRSNNVSLRMYALSLAYRESMVALHQTDMLDDAEPVETMAHWLLRDHHLGGEWFAVEPAEAVEAVASAALLVGQGERAPKRIGFKTALSKRLEIRTYFKMPSVTIRRVQEWRRRQPNLPSQSEAIRLLVEQALAADEKG